MSSLLRHLGAFCAQRRLLVLLVWLLIATASVLVLKAVPDTTNNDLSLPGTDSQAATDLLAAEFPPQQNGGSPIVFHVKSGKLTGDSDTKAIQASVKAIGKLPHVYSASDPTANPQAGLISKNGQTAFSTVLMDVGTADLTPELARSVLDAAEPARQAGMEVEAGGPIGSVLSPSDTGDSELIGIIAAIIILTFTFGALVAMGMPILLAILGLLGALAVVRVVGIFVNIASTGPTLATMIGLGVGIDYALFLVTRHRDNLRAGLEPHDSIADAVAGSGSAIVFAGTTVVIALLSLMVAGIPLVTSLGYATAIAVAVAVIAAITLLPALLSLVGRRLNALRLPRWLHPEPKPEGKGLWAHWAALVSRHRFAATVLALAILVPLAIPLLSLRLGQEDVGVTPTTTTERRAFDIMSKDFGPGYNGPLLVAVSLDPKAAPSQQYQDQYNQATALKNSLTKQQQQLQEQADQLQAQEEELTRQGDALQAQKAQLEAQQKQLEKQQHQLEAQARTLAAQEATLRARQASLQRQADQLRREGTALRARAGELARKLVTLRREDVRLAREIRQAPTPAERAKLRAERRAVRADIRRTRSALRGLAPKARRLLAQARSLSQQAVALKQQADQLQREADQLQRQAEALAAKGQSLQQQANQLQKQADKLNKQAAALQKQADKLNKQKKSLQQQQKQAEALQDQITAELTKAGGDDRGTDPRLVSLQDALATPQDVTLVSPPNISKAGTAATFTVIPKTRPADPVTADLVTQLREQVIPPALTTAAEKTAEDQDMSPSASPSASPSGSPAAAAAGSPATVEQAALSASAPGYGSAVAYVGGSTAANVDLAAKITRQLPLVILTVLALSFLLLMIAFRSLLIPLQAAITNLLTAAASFGVLTACFQWGWGLDLVHLDSPYGTVPIASYVPLMMFAALFGLSMDYEVFFVSHVQHFHAGGDSVRDAVRRGLAASSRVIVAAAVIMFCVFASFVLADDPIIKQFGVGLSVAVALAGAMVILLAPALLAMFGAGAFWVPRWLGAILPHMNLEGEAPSAPPVAPAGVPTDVGQGPEPSPATPETEPSPAGPETEPLHATPRHARSDTTGTPAPVLAAAETDRALDDAEPQVFGAEPTSTMDAVPDHQPTNGTEPAATTGAVEPTEALAPVTASETAVPVPVGALTADAVTAPAEAEEPSSSIDPAGVPESDPVRDSGPDDAATIST